MKEKVVYSENEGLKGEILIPCLRAYVESQHSKDVFWAQDDWCARIDRSLAPLH